MDGSNEVLLNVQPVRGKRRNQPTVTDFKKQLCLHDCATKFDEGKSQIASCGTILFSNDGLSMPLRGSCIESLNCEKKVYVTYPYGRFPVSTSVQCVRLCRCDPLISYLRRQEVITWKRWKSATKMPSNPWNEKGYIPLVYDQHIKR